MEKNHAQRQSVRLSYNCFKTTVYGSSKNPSTLHMER